MRVLWAIAAWFWAVREWLGISRLLDRAVLRRSEGNEIAAAYGNDQKSATESQVAASDEADRESVCSFDLEEYTEALGEALILGGVSYWKMSFIRKGRLAVDNVDNGCRVDSSSSASGTNTFIQALLEWDSADDPQVERESLTSRWMASQHRKRQYFMSSLGCSSCSVQGKVHLLPNCVNSRVYKGWYKDSVGNLHAAAVKFKDTSELASNLVATNTVQKELAVLDELGDGHPNVVQCFGGNATGAHFELKNLERIGMPGEIDFLVLEFLPCTLRQLIHKDEEFERTCTYKRLIEMFLDIAKGLEFLHRNRIAHCNLKVDNVLVSETGGAKLAGLGSARVQTKQSVVNRVQCMFRHMTHHGHSGKTPKSSSKGFSALERFDICSLGVVMAECITKRRCLGYLDLLTVPREILSLIDACCAYSTTIGSTNSFPCTRDHHTIALAESWLQDRWSGVRGQAHSVGVRNGLGVTGHAGMGISGITNFGKNRLAGVRRCFIQRQKTRNAKNWWKDKGAKKDLNMCLSALDVVKRLDAMLDKPWGDSCPPRVPA